jgi:hypothetical protein
LISIGAKTWQVLFLGCDGIPWPREQVGAKSVAKAVWQAAFAMQVIGLCGLMI